MDISGGFTTETLPSSRETVDIAIAEAFRRAIPIIRRKCRQVCQMNKAQRISNSSEQKTQLDVSQESEKSAPVLKTTMNSELNGSVNRKRFLTDDSHSSRIESAYHLNLTVDTSTQQINGIRRIGLWIVG